MRPIALALVASLAALPAWANLFDSVCQGRPRPACDYAQAAAAHEMRESNLLGGGWPPSIRACVLQLETVPVEIMACAKRLRGLPDEKLLVCVHTLPLHHLADGGAAAHSIKACVQRQR